MPLSRPKPTRTAARSAYAACLNRAIDHLVLHVHRGSTRLRLDDVAHAAGLSPFHFHRVFQALMGETVAEFARRLRLEKALAMMALSRTEPLATIARRCGFSSPSELTRSFKQRFGLPPSAFSIEARRRDHLADLRRAMDHWGTPPGPGSSSAKPPVPDLRVSGLPPAAPRDAFALRVRDLPARRVAYIRVRDPYRGDSVPKAAARLVAWAQRHAGASGQWLGYQWENPEITALHNCQYFVAVVLPADAHAHAVSTPSSHRHSRPAPRPSGEVGFAAFPPMVVAQIDICDTLDDELAALQWLYHSWLPSSGYVPDDHPAFEAWASRPFAHGLDHFELAVQLPVRRATPRR